MQRTHVPTTALPIHLSNTAQRDCNTSRWKPDEQIRRAGHEGQFPREHPRFVCIPSLIRLPRIGFSMPAKRRASSDWQDFSCLSVEVQVSFKMATGPKVRGQPGQSQLGLQGNIVYPSNHMMNSTNSAAITGSGFPPLLHGSSASTSMCKNQNFASSPSAL
jgi:hypothetical protein